MGNQNIMEFKNLEQIEVVNRNKKQFKIRTESKVFLNPDGDQDFNYLICDKIIYYIAGALQGSYSISGFYYDKANIRRGARTAFINEKDMFLDVYNVTD